jgi:trehalose/maltose hydrolase-like predicted phosphorylase
MRKTDRLSEKLTGWEVIYNSFDPSFEKLREALCTLANGYMGLRGAATERASSKEHYPGTYVAGLYNTLPTMVSGKKIFNEDLVNCPDPLLLSFRVNRTEWTDTEEVKILSYEQKLDLKNGMLTKTRRVKDSSGNITLISEKRLVHMKHPHLAALEYNITPQNYSGEVLIRSYIDGSIENSGVARYRDLNSKHLGLVSSGRSGNNVIHLTTETRESKIKISESSRIQIFIGGRRKNPKTELIKEKERIGLELHLGAEKNKTISIEKTCAIFTSKDPCAGSPGKNALKTVSSAPRFKVLEKTHKKEWARLWKKCDIKISGDVFTQTALRFHIFHLLQSANANNVGLNAGLGPRGLHGEAYRGHIFWDEIFFMPFFSSHLPETAEALLLYRYNRLAEARKYAKNNGYEGAMFPWQSGSSGKEETQSIHLNPMSGKWGEDLSRNQRHVSFAIAYNAWRHWIITGRRVFFESHGAELILSIAKFAASLCLFDKTDGRYHTEGLMGPDEFHEKLPLSREAGLRDNTYSNIFIVWILMRALDTLETLPADKSRKIKKKLGITAKTLVTWRDIAGKIKVIMNRRGIISQFEGYFGLEELDWASYKKKYGNIHRMDRILKAEGKSPDSYKVAKQADVLMLFYLFPFEDLQSIFSAAGYTLDKKLLLENYKYYEKRTSHGSTLSKVVHCYISRLLGMNKVSLDWFTNVLEADLHDFKDGTTLEGIHTGIMGGSIDIVQRAFAGVQIEGGRVLINPHLPSGWKTLKFGFSVRGVRIDLVISRKSVRLETSPFSSASKKVIFIVKGKRIEAQGKKEITIRF